MITTSYFAGPAPKDRKVSIARKVRFFSGPRVLELAPEDPWAKGDWRARYRAEIAARFPNPEDLRRFLENIEAQVHDPILCCHEKNAEDCHRRVLAEIVREQLGLDIPEWSA